MKIPSTSSPALFCGLGGPLWSLAQHTSAGAQVPVLTPLFCGPLKHWPHALGPCLGCVTPELSEAAASAMPHCISGTFP